MLIDTHAHLFSPNYKDDLPQVINRAIDAGVEYIIVPATDLVSAAQSIELSEKYPMIYSTVGVHPHDTKEWNESLLPKLKELAKHPKVVAIGEIGLDYFYDFSPKPKQIEAFQSQIELALELHLPVVVHNRESNEDLLEILTMYSDKDLRAQLHCFSGSKQMAKEIIKLGHLISFTGNITFPKLDELRAIAASISVEDLLLETDSPYMTPKPYRGERNEPAYVKLVAEKIAEVSGLTVDDVARITSANVFRLFGVGRKPDVSYTYQIGHSLYINVTNRCNADCIFCDRKGEAIIGGYNLKMEKTEEPPASFYIKEIGDPKKYNEIVFCGYGEPTIRWDVVKSIAKYVKDNGGKTRINTNGHGNVINHRDITPELKGLIDTISISLNTTDSKEYARIMKLNESFFYEMIDFAKKSKGNAENVVLSAVTLDEVDIEKAQKFAEEDLGVSFRRREYF